MIVFHFRFAIVTLKNRFDIETYIVITFCIYTYIDTVQDNVQLNPNNAGIMHKVHTYSISTLHGMIVTAALLRQNLKKQTLKNVQYSKKCQFEKCIAYFIFHKTHIAYKIRFFRIYLKEKYKQFLWIIYS